MLISMENCPMTLVDHHANLIERYRDPVNALLISRALDSENSSMKMNSPGIYVFSSAAIPADRWTAFEKQSVEKLPLDREGYIDKKMKKHGGSKKYWNAAGDFLYTVELHLSELVREQTDPTIGVRLPYPLLIIFLSHNSSQGSDRLNPLDENFVPINRIQINRGLLYVHWLEKILTHHRLCYCMYVAVNRIQVR